MKKLLLYLPVILFFILSGCTTAPLEVAIIKIKGSDTMYNLVSRLAEEYMKKNPGVSVYVEGGGTATGIKSLARGEVDICTASRTLKSDEVKLLAEKFGILGVSTLIAKDALSIFVNQNNSVRSFTSGELKNIFSGKIKNWKELQGTDAQIIPVIRNINSGTYLYFKEHILGGEEYSESSITCNTTSEIIRAVEENKYAVGYGGIGFNGDIFHANVDGIAPTVQNVQAGIYPITRYLYFFTLSNPEGKLKKFIDWVLSADGQNVISQSGFIPIWKNPN
ncbi:MAG: PstS family phosphate ABC transporter substrate-binding protein [Ignavibacteriaceae bacterium]|nr:PstS family phosphate ABC transporter substrate-binding protein [Ignavibacteriaceae bacterium]